MTGRIIQVTEKSICVSVNLLGNFEDSIKHSFDDDCSTISAAIHIRTSTIITIQRAAAQITTPSATILL